MSNLVGKSMDDGGDLSKAIDQYYSGTGSEKEKEQIADSMNNTAKKDDLPDDAKPGEQWKKPILEVYEDFTKWIDKWYEVMELRRKEGKKDITYDWYKSGSEINSLDRENFRKKLFNTDGIQEKYKEYLDGKAGVNGDPIGIKFQTGNILADERAFYIRHATIPLLMSTGLMRNIQYNFLKSVYLTFIKKLREYEDDNYKTFHEDRDKGEANGTNNKAE